MSNLSVVGQPVRRVDAFEKVTGLLKYGIDLSTPDMLIACTKRSPYPHARILAIDTSRAELLPGVEAVVTAADVRGTNLHGIERQDQPVLVPLYDRVRMIGDPVAAVAARNREIAEEAVELIEVEYQELPVVATIEDALSPRAPLIHDGFERNVCSEYHYVRGNPDKILHESDVVVEDVFELPRQEHAYLEPEGGLAMIDAEGIITIAAGTQRPRFVLSAICEALGFSATKVRVVGTSTGGAFGGKADLSMQALIALLAHKTQKAVRLIWSRDESFLASTKRHPMIVHAKLGAMKDGRLAAFQADLLADGGAYASHSLRVAWAAGTYFPGPYHIPNLKIDAMSVFTNNPISGACRGSGQPQAVLVLESLMAEMSVRLEIDPVEFRLMNGLRMGMEPGSPRITLNYEPTLSQTLKQASEAAGPKPKSSILGKRIGRGIASAMPIFDISAEDGVDMRGVGASVELFPDGTALVRTGVPEIGNGITTVLVQVAAEELGLTLDKVSVLHGQTASTPDAGPVVASRQAYCSGNAVRLAAIDIRMRIMEVASEILNMPLESLEISGDYIIVPADAGRSVPLGEVTQVCHRSGVDLVGKAWFAASHADAGHTFMTSIADVEVDEETGQVRVLKLVNAHDSGRALNPLNVKGQLIGGAMMGLGYALLEDFETENGRIAFPPRLHDYLFPTSLDGPDTWAPVIIEHPYDTGPYGAKGVGEHGTDTTPAAIMNAIYDAIGTRVNRLPALPERVRQAQLRARDESKMDVTGFPTAANATPDSGQ
ncbi:MAG: xanthine dehydrogenase family protein molybdopterin-binding subunit [Pseudomonadota bacterium]